MKKLLNKVMIIDGSYLLHRGLKIEELWALKSSKTGLRTGGVYAFLKSLNHEFRNIDYYPVVCWDSGLATRRTEVYPMYKRNHLRETERLIKDSFRLDESVGSANTPSDDEILNQIERKFSGNSSAISEAMESAKELLKQSRLNSSALFDPDDYRAQYHRQREVLITILNSIGVPSIKVSGWEGDDLMVLLQRISNKSIIMTDDKDLIQMIAPNTDIFRPMQKQYLTYNEYLSSENMNTPREMVIIKAIVGDGSDNIPGVTSGLERKYALGGTRARTVAKIILESNEDPSKYIPILEGMNKNYYKGFIQNHEAYLRNMKLVDLSLVPDDEEVIKDIVSEVVNHAGKCNLISALALLAEQDITSFDVNSFISKMNVLSCGIRA